MPTTILTSETFGNGPPYLVGWIDHTVDANTRLSIENDKLRLDIEPDDFAFLGHRSEIRYNSNLIHGEEHRYAWSFTIPSSFINHDPSLFSIMGQIHDNSLTNSSPTTFRNSHADLSAVQAVYPTHVAAWQLLPEWNQILLPDNSLSVLEMHVIDFTKQTPTRTVVGVVPIIKGTEFDMVLEIKGATDKTGYLKWWHNGTQIVNLAGLQTLWDASHDTNPGGENPHRFTVGQYFHESVKNFNHVLIDNIKIEKGIGTMAGVTYKDVVSDGNNTDYDVIFPFLDRDHVKVKYNSVEQGNIFSFLSDAQIRLNAAAPSGTVVRVCRETPKTVLTDFPSSNLTEADLDNGYLHNLYMAQEMQDTFDEAIAGTLSVTVLPKGKFDATAAPTVNDDSSLGYDVGSPWVDITNDKSYICVDETVGAAVWIETSAVGGIADLVDDTTPQLGGNLDRNGFTIDGRIPSTDGAKLDGIESGATADQTGAEIKAAYEAEADTNAFTDADHTKLDGIDTNANNYSHPNHTGDVTSSGDGAQTIADEAVTNAKLAHVATDTFKGRTTAATGDVEDLTLAQARTMIGQPVIQMVVDQESSTTTTTELIPVDDTIPQQSGPEGADSGLSVTITPKSTSSRLVIEWDLMVSNDTTGSAVFGVLYQDSDADALAVSVVYPASGSLLDHLRGSFEMAAGTTSATTFKLWIGASIASTTRTNGVSGRLFGTAAKSIMRVTEYAV